MKAKENWPFFCLTGLGHLCEFIEDCEHTVLATRILHLLGREGPRSQNPSKYIRFIYNRVILENAAVRAGKNDVDPRLFSRESRSNCFFLFLKTCFGCHTRWTTDSRRFYQFALIVVLFLFHSCRDISCQVWSSLWQPVFKHLGSALKVCLLRTKIQSHELISYQKTE